MPLISVSGATSRAGKTSLAVTLARAFPPGTVTAIKFTTTEDEHTGCARGSPCTVCDIDVDFRILTDDAVIREPGTDTARLVECGTRQVIWCIARRSALRRAWHRVLERIPPQDVILLEGSSILSQATPDLSFFVINPALPLNRWKSTSRDLIGRCDFVCINRPTSKRSFKPVTAALEAARDIRCRDDIRIVDVQQDLSLWSDPQPWERLRLLRPQTRSAGTG